MRTGLLWLVLSVWIGQGAARAIVLFGTGNPSANTTPPVGALGDSGWRTQTEVAPSATVIGRNLLLTARHIGHRVGDAIHFDGLTYPVQRRSDAPDGDLRMLEVAGRLDSNRIAQLYTGSDESGRAAVLHGYGLARGIPVYRDGPLGPELRGWQWGTAGARLRWGTNVITDVTNIAGAGSFIRSLFSGNAGGDEATVSIGDSGGGVFIRDADGLWKLAGVMIDVEGSFAASITDEPFHAALFDRRGFFEQESDGTWQQLPEAGIEPGTFWLATRISSYRDWISTELARPPDDSWPRLFSGDSLMGPFVEHSAYAVNPSLRKISFKADGRQRFLQLGGSTPIESIRTSGDLVELLY